MLKKTSGKEYFYSVSGLIPPKYMVEDTLMEDMEFFVDWVSKNTDKLEDLLYNNIRTFITEMELLYRQLCSINAHWLEMEAARILRLTEIDEGDLCHKLIEPFISNLKTLAIDIQMAQNKGFENSYRQRSDIERYRNVISSLKVVAQLLEGKDFMKAFDIAISIDELKESEYDIPFMASLTTKNEERAMELIAQITAECDKKIDDIINKATESVTLKKVMLVDDMPEMLTTLSLMLKEHFQVFSFTSGNQALDFLDRKKQHPDAFLLDVDMPEMDGFTLAKRIRGRAKHETTPILFLTGNSTRDVFMKSMMFGAKAFIVKPANKDIIISKLSSCI